MMLPVLQAIPVSMVCQRGEPTPDALDLAGNDNSKNMFQIAKFQSFSSIYVTTKKIKITYRYGE